MEQRKFLAMVGPLAQADMQKSGILASLTIAQAILESGWGASELATKANALFGIKADARWSGKAYSKDTKECYDGATYTTITALFRAYDSWAESVADHSAFLLANKRYAAVVGERDYKVACKAIKAAGYATDPGYPQKLIGLIEKYGLTVYDGKAEQEDKTSMNISITKKTSTHNTTAAAGRAIRYIVVHYTAGVTSKPGSAAGTASYFGGTSKQVSADFIVDDGGAVQYNGDIRNRYTWHCGGGKYNTKGGAYYGKATNRNTIGIEVCSTNDTGKMTVANDSHWRFTDKVVSNLVELVKYLMAEYGIDAAHVIRHYDVNGKPCPGIIGWNEDTGSAAKWAAFKARLGAATPGGQTGGSTNTGTATGNTALTYKVGDIVQFAVLGASFTALVIPWLKDTGLPWLKEKRLYSIVKKFVEAAEKQAEAGTIGKATKKRFVVELLEANGITVTPEIDAFIEAAVKELDLAEKNAIGEIGKIFSDAEQTPQN